MHTHWLCVTRYRNGLGASDPRQVFDDACDDLCEAMDKGLCDSAEVFQMDFDGNRLVNVTDDARARVAQWVIARKQPLPDWLCANRFAAE